MDLKFENVHDLTNHLGMLVDFILNNIRKNMLYPLRENEEVKKNPYVQLPNMYNTVMTALFLKYSQKLTIKELCNTLNIKNSNLTPILNNMEKDGFIRRFVNEQNRKFVFVELTEKSLEYFKEYHLVSDIVWEELLTSAFTVPQLEDLYVTMLKLNAYLNKMRPDDVMYDTEKEAELKDQLLISDAVKEVRFVD